MGRAKGATCSTCDDVIHILLPVAMALSGSSNRLGEHCTHCGGVSPNWHPLLKKPAVQGVAVRQGTQVEPVEGR